MFPLRPYTISAFPGVPSSGGKLGTMLSMCLHIYLPHNPTDNQTASYVSGWDLANGYFWAHRLLGTFKGVNGVEDERRSVNNFQYFKELNENSTFAWIWVALSSRHPLSLLLAVWLYQGLSQTNQKLCGAKSNCDQSPGLWQQTDLGIMLCASTSSRMTLMELLDLSEPQCPPL